MPEHLTVPVDVALILPSDLWVIALGKIIGIRRGSQTTWFGPIRMTAAQIASPTAAMLADSDATYELNVAPYTRYVSNGTVLLAVTAA